MLRRAARLLCFTVPAVVLQILAVMFIRPISVVFSNAIVALIWLLAFVLILADGEGEDDG